MMLRYNRPQVVILGGGYAGMLAAARIARADIADVTLIDAKPEFVQRIRLHEALAGTQPRTLAYAPLLKRRNIYFVQGYVDSINPARQQVTGRATDGTTLIKNYDYLIVALGSRTATTVPGVAEYAVRLDDLSTTQQAHGRLHEIAKRHGRVLVVGGGLSGIETATEIAERMPSLHMTLVTEGMLGDNYTQKAADHIHQRIAGLGIELVEKIKIIGIDKFVAYTPQTEIPFDLSVWTGGFEAAPVGRQNGFIVDQQGRIIVDPLLRVPTQPNIFAIGDAASAAHGEASIRMACASAMPMGAYAGDAVVKLMRGLEPQPFAFGFVARCISLGRHDALLQFVQPDDTPRKQAWKGLPAVLTKEAICRSTFGIVHNELRLGVPLLQWKGAKRTHPVGQIQERLRP